MPNLRGSEWLIIILLIVLLFGAKRLPDAARSIGRSLRIFKAETKGLAEAEGASAPQPPAGTQPAQAAQPDATEATRELPAGHPTPPEQAGTTHAAPQSQPPSQA
jgi:sec-independent protein translocase protein TatA